MTNWIDWTAPAALVMSVGSAHAVQYLSLAEAQRHAFPSATNFSVVQADRIWRAEVGERVLYTDFARGYLGRLDVAIGKVTEWQSPSGPKSEPYGIVFTKGALWYNESFAKPNTIVRFDPKAEKFQTWAIPGGGDIVRNMDVTPDGNLVMANSLVNQVGLVQIK